MSHFTTPQFWRLYNSLPADIRALADKNFTLLKDSPEHRGLHFKSVGPYWSVRVGLRYRALAKKRDEGYVWFWIGPHSAYDALVSG